MLLKMTIILQEQPRQLQVTHAALIGHLPMWRSAQTMQRDYTEMTRPSQVVKPVWSLLVGQISSGCTTHRYSIISVWWTALCMWLMSFLKLRYMLVVEGHIWSHNQTYNAVVRTELFLYTVYTYIQNTYKIPASHKCSTFQSAEENSVSEGFNVIVNSFIHSLAHSHIICSCSGLML